MQSNVQQQIAIRKEEILRIIRLSSAKDFSFAWIFELLESRRLARSAGALVRLAETPTQRGSIIYGTWLTTEHEFWEFSVFAPSDTRELPEVESFSNVTESTSIADHLPGIKRSFGSLAMEAFYEVRLSANP